jgi:hypothetical protein
VLDLRSSIYDWNGKNLWSRLRLRGQDTHHRHARDARLGAGRQLYFAIRFSRPLQAHQLMNREEGVEYKGFASPGKNPAEKVLVEGKALEAALGFGQLGNAAAGEGGGVRRQRGRRAGQPGRDAGLGLRRRARPRARGLGTGAGRGRDRRAAADEAHGLHQPVSQPAGAQPVHGPRRQVPRPGQPGAPGRRLPLPLDLLAVGHLPRPASAADPDPAGAAQRRLRALADRLAAGQPLRHPAGVAVCRPGNLVHDRLPRGAGHRRRLHEGHPRLRPGARRCAR